MGTGQPNLVVFGCPVANRSWCINEWWKAVTQQTVDDRWSVAFVHTKSDDDTLGKLESMQNWHDVAILDGGESPRSREEMNFHRWPPEHFEHMATWRNMLLDHAQERGAEWFFSVDSDIILPPLAFVLLKHQLAPYLDEGFGAIAPLVNMAVHLDQFAYNFMRWNDADSMAGVRSELVPTHPFPTGVIMAAMLIHRSAFHVRWAAHPQGEDLGWSNNARENGVRLMVDPTVTCNHLMKPVPQ